MAAGEESAIRLLQDFGFETEGRKKDSYLGEDEKYHDVLIMCKILDEINLSTNASLY